MSSEARNELLEWYHGKVAENYVFDFQKEILFYCKVDVKILAMARLKFREIYVKETTVDPFLDSLTIASACMLSFQKLFLKDDQIGIIPRSGYRLVDNQSRTALLWLDWVIHSEQKVIMRAGNGREVVPDGLNFKVDGFADNTMYCFRGC